MSNVEQEITDLVGEVIEDKVDDAISNHYDFQDMISRIDSLESERNYDCFVDLDHRVDCARRLSVFFG